MTITTPQTRNDDDDDELVIRNRNKLTKSLMEPMMSTSMICQEVVEVERENRAIEDESSKNIDVLITQSKARTSLPDFRVNTNILAQNLDNNEVVAIKQQEEGEESVGVKNREEEEEERTVNKNNYKLNSKLAFQRTNHIKKRRNNNNNENINSFNSLEMPSSSLKDENIVELTKLRSKSMINYDYHLYSNENNNNNTHHLNDNNNFIESTIINCCGDEETHVNNNDPSIISSRSTLESSVGSRSQSISPSSIFHNVNNNENNNNNNNINIQSTSNSSSSSSALSLEEQRSRVIQSTITSTEQGENIERDEEEDEEEDHQILLNSNNNKYLSSSASNILDNANCNNNNNNNCNNDLEMNNNDLIEDNLFFENISKG